MASSSARLVVLLGLFALLSVSVVSVSARRHPPYPPPPPYPGGKYAYGRAFGSVVTWYRNDIGVAHHMEVNFTTIKDLDSGAAYSNFQANMNVRSNDGSSVLAAVVNGSALSSVMGALKGSAGVHKLDASTGLLYSSFLKATDFSPMTEDAVLTMYDTLLKLSQKGGQVCVFGQIYSDSNGAHGIHDVHRIVANNGEFKNYGDGGLLVKDAKGNYYGIFLHFDNQNCC